MSKSIKETSELIDAAISIVETLAEHKADDGKISAIEAAQTAMANIPAIITAVQGVDQIDEEMKDMTPEEAQILAAKGVALAKAVWSLVVGDKN